MSQYMPTQTRWLVLDSTIQLKNGGKRIILREPPIQSKFLKPLTGPIDGLCSRSSFKKGLKNAQRKPRELTSGKTVGLVASRIARAVTQNPSCVNRNAIVQIKKEPDGFCSEQFLYPGMLQQRALQKYVFT